MSVFSDVPSKSDLRAVALARRDALTPEVRATAAASIASRDLALDIAPGRIVAGYWPIRSELDPRPLMIRLAAQGARLALPAIAASDSPLLFRAWSPGDALIRGQFGIREPAPDAEQLAPDIVLVPLAAFDRAGHRIGYGAGYYDRTFARWRGVKPFIAMGLAFSAQEIPVVPSAAHDARLDIVLTEREIIDFRSF